MQRKCTIAIIGGGIGGLAAAIALRARGFQCDVYEQAARMSDIGAGLNLSPNALKAFRALGVEAQMIAAGCQDELQSARNWKTGAVTAQQSRLAGVEGKYGASFLTIHRADVQNVLLSKFPAEHLHLGKSCKSVEEGPNGARIVFADGSEAIADCVIGADGIHSAVRDALFGPQPPHFTGCICYRGMVAYEKAKHILGADNLNAWWGPHGHVVYYRVRGGQWVNFVAHYDSDAWTEESWTRECSRDEVLQTFAGWNENLLQLFELGDNYYKWALYDRDPLPQWGRGAVTLLGDSVHPMLPYLGQGAAMALEDAVVLARILDQAVPGGNSEKSAGDLAMDISKALRCYENTRRPRTTNVQLASRAMGKENHLKSPLARFWRDTKIALRRRFAKDKSTLRADWVYHFDPATCPLNSAGN